MSPQMYTPSGFRLPPRTRGRVIPINLRRRGMGDAASDYAAIAANLAPGSALQAEALGCAANPTPYCSQAMADALSTPYLNATDYANTVRSIAAGQGPAPLTATTFTGPPAGTSIPTAPAQPVATAALPIVQVAPATPNIQPVSVPATTPMQTLQPSGSPSALPNPRASNAGQASFLASGFLTTPILGFPLWLWGVAGVGAYFLFFSGGRHGRY
jgi:hypothetical protein